MYEPSMQFQFSVEEILNDKIIDGKLLYFVKWKGFSMKQSSWQPEEHLKNAPDQIQLWKEKKIKLQRIDKINRRKRLEEESFDGQKYIKKNTNPIKPSEKQKREKPQRKNKKAHSQIKQNPENQSTSEDDDSKSCNSETTSYRGKGLKRKQAKHKDPIEYILESIKKLEQKKLKLIEIKRQKVPELSTELPTNNRSKNSTPKQASKRKKNIKEQSTIKKECLKKMNIPAKQTKGKQSKKVDKNLSINTQKSNIEKNSKNKLTLRESLQKSRALISQKKHQEHRKEMFSISKKDLMARCQRPNPLLQNLPQVTGQLPQIYPQISKQTSHQTAQQIPPHIPQHIHPQQIHPQMPQKILQQVPPRISQQIHVQNLSQQTPQYIPREVTKNIQERSFQQSFNQDPNKIYQFQYQPPQAPVITSFAKVSRELKNSQEERMNQHLFGGIMRYGMENERKKIERKSHSQGILMNRTFQSKDYVINKMNIQENSQSKILPSKVPQVRSEQKNLSKDLSRQKSYEAIRPAIYDEIQKQKEKQKHYRQRDRSRDRSRDQLRNRSRSRHEHRTKKYRKDKKKKDNSRHKHKKHSHKHKKSRRDSSSKQLQERRHKKKRRHQSSESSSDRSESPQFSTSSNEQQMSKLGISIQKKENIGEIDELQQIMLPSEKRNPEYLQSVKVKNPQKSSRVDNNKKKSQIHNSRQRDQLRKNKQVIEIAESSQNNSSSLAIIDQEQFAGRAKKRVALNEEYNCRYKTSYSHNKQLPKSRDEQNKMAQFIDVVQVARSLIDFLQQHPTKWWFKDMRNEIKQIRKGVREDSRKRQSQRNQNVIKFKQSFNESQDNWNFPFDNSYEPIKLQANVRKQDNTKQHKDKSQQQKSLNKASKTSNQVSTQSKKANEQKSTQPTTQCFNLLIGDVLDWFKDTYPDDEVTQEIRRQVYQVVRKMVEQDLDDDDPVEKWMDNYGKRKKEKMNGEKEKIKNVQIQNKKIVEKQQMKLVQMPIKVIQTPIETLKQNSQEIKKNNDSLELTNFKHSFDIPRKEPDFITSYFKPKPKKGLQNIIKLENDNIQAFDEKPSSISTNPSQNCLLALQSKKNNQLVKSQAFETQNVQNPQLIKEDPRRLIYQDYPLQKEGQKKPQQNEKRQQNNTNPQQKPQKPQKPQIVAQNTNAKAKKVVQSNNIIKVLSQFEYKGQKCFKILLNNGKEANAHEVDVKKNCPKILFEYYEQKMQALENERRRNGHHGRGR